MSRRLRVLRSVPVGRVIAALGSAALLTRAQMYPSPADLHALFAFALLRVLHFFDGFDVTAIHDWKSTVDSPQLTVSNVGPSTVNFQL